MQEGDDCLLYATIEKRGAECARALRLSVESNGVVLAGPIKPADQEKNYRFDIGRLARGLYPIRAVLETSDGRITRSNEHLLLVGHAADPFTLWVGALFLILLLSLSVGLFWIDQPPFRASADEWLKWVRDALSVLVPVVIGGLFIYLGYREHTIWRAGEAAGDAAIWRQRSLIRRQLTDETIPYRIPRIRRWLDSGNLWVVLTFVGVVPIYFLMVRLAARFGLPEGGAALSLLVILAAGAAIAFLFLSAGRGGARPPSAVATPDARSAEDAVQRPDDVAAVPESAARASQDQGEGSTAAPAPDETSTSSSVSDSDRPAERRDS